MEAIVAVVPGVAVDLAPDRDRESEHPAGTAGTGRREEFAHHRAKMAAHFAGKAELNLEGQRMDKTSRKAKIRVPNRA